MQLWSGFVADLSNKSACLPSIQNLTPTRSQWDLSVMVFFWLGLCSFWRHTLQRMLLKSAKQLAVSEYGENPRPSFVELPRDQKKVEELNAAWKKEVFKISKDGKSSRKHDTPEDGRSNEKEKEATKEKKKKQKKEKEKDKEKEKHTQELQKFIDRCEDKQTKESQVTKEWCQKMGWNEEELVKYWKYYSIEEQKEELVHKYLEEMWKCLTVAFNALIGCYVMWSQPSFWNTQLLWSEFPQIETWQMTMFYAIGVGYHLHRAVFQFFDHYRKDFVAMVLHHWTTVGLIWLSWHYGLTACGTIVMFCHDATDFFLAAAKICGYHHYTFFKELFFVLFVLHWIFIRMGLFAWKIVLTSTFDTVPSHSCHWAWYFFIPGLWVLLSLHCYWLTFILNIIYRKVCLRKSIVDTRSDSDTYDEE